MSDGWIYLAGRSGDWLRVDGENMAAAPIERILIRLPDINLVAVYAVPDENVGDQIMAAVVLNDGAALTPESFRIIPCSAVRSLPQGMAAVRPHRARPADDRHAQGAQTRTRGAGSDARRRRALGSRAARHPVRARLVLAQRPAEVGDRIPVLPGWTVQRHRVLAGIGTRVPVLPGRAVDGLRLRRTGRLPSLTAQIGAQTAATIAGRSNFDMRTACPISHDFKPAGCADQPTTIRSFSHPRTVDVGASCAVS